MFIAVVVIIIWSPVADSSPCSVAALTAERLPPLISKFLEDTRLACRNYLLLIICSRAATAILLYSKL